MSRHRVPTHLSIPDGIGKFSFRQIVLLGGSMLYVAPRVWTVLPKDGPALGDVLRAGYPGLGFLFPPDSLPIIPLIGVAATIVPFAAAALPLDPPFEHGLLAIARWASRGHGYHDAARAAVDFGELVVDGDRIESNYGYHAIWEMPTANLRLADTAEVDRAEDQWGEFLTGLTGPIQSVVRSTRVDPEQIVARIERYLPSAKGLAVTNKARAHAPSENARTVAASLRAMVKDHHLIERRHYLAVMAPDETTFADTVDEIADAIGQLGLQSNLVRRLADDELRQVVQGTWSTKLPEQKRLGPIERPFNAVSAWYADGEWHAVIAWGKWPRVMPDNALSPLVDGIYDVDTIVDFSPVEADEILGGLERRSEALKVTDSMGRFRKRLLAIEDLDEFIIKLESGEESAFDVAIYLHVHGPTRKGVEQDVKRLSKRVRRSGARTNTLPWEQAEAIQSVAPLSLNRLSGRTKRVDTSSAKNLYPWTASSMWMKDAVPMGETLDSKRPVGLNCWYQPVIPNGHMAVYALTGGGKGFLVKIFESRELFSGMTNEIFAFDQADEDPVNGEYGRWAEYCGLEYRHVTEPADFAPALADLDNYRWLGPGIVFNIAQLALEHRPEFLATFKARLWKRAAALPARRKWMIDELWSFVKISEVMGADPHQVAMCLAAIEDLIRRGRHLHVGGVLMTQRIKDALDVPVMQIVQEQCGIQCYGLQNPSHITDVADRMHWTPAVVRQIKKLTAGQWVISAGPWQVAMQCTFANQDEYDMANTDNLGENAAA